MQWNFNISWLNAIHSFNGKESEKENILSLCFWWWNDVVAPHLKCMFRFHTDVCSLTSLENRPLGVHARGNVISCDQIAHRKIRIYPNRYTANGCSGVNRKIVLFLSFFPPVPLFLQAIALLNNYNNNTATVGIQKSANVPLDSCEQVFARKSIFLLLYFLFFMIVVHTAHIRWKKKQVREI